MTESRRHGKNLEKRNAEALPLDQAVQTIKSFQGTKFDETVEIAVRTGIDPKNTTQSVRGSFSLPHGIGKKVRVVAFCDPAQEKLALEAGAIAAGGEELAKKIEGGWTEFDVALAHPGMMRFVGKLGRVLGPQGKMPSPKSGTVTANIVEAVREFVAGKIEFRNEDTGIIHASMGKKSFPAEHLVANVNAFLDHLTTLRPHNAKGVFIRRVFLKCTMSPSVQIVYESVHHD
ncbi:MAG: 50S ribosomal protein L1 [Planctomycetes bacterium]|nr:50S ribosomal protein L1 [Planctomycetota bacterium]